MRLAISESSSETAAERAVPNRRPFRRTLTDVLLEMEPANASGSGQCGSATPLDFPKLVSRCLGDRTFAVRILETFREHVKLDLAALEETLRSADWQRVADTAHRLKGAAASAAAEPFADLAAELEECCRSRCLARIPECMNRLRAEWEHVRRCTESFGVSA